MTNTPLNADGFPIKLETFYYDKKICRIVRILQPLEKNLSYYNAIVGNLAKIYSARDLMHLIELTDPLDFLIQLREDVSLLEEYTQTQPKRTDLIPPESRESLESI